MTAKPAPHRARKRFGQNFLRDESVIRRIVAAIHPLAKDHVVEIGPGRGALTAALLEKLDSLQVIELDRDLIPILQQKFSSHTGLQIHQGDALKFDFSSLHTPPQPLRIIGNLPYNISTPLLFHLLQFHELISDMHFMLQKELVQRLAADPGNKHYGRLSVMAQYYCAIESLFEVAPSAFSPAPKVNSAIVRLTPKPASTAVTNIATLDRLLRAVFGQRRKTLRNSLKNLLTTEQCEILCETLPVDLGQRPEQLTLDAFVSISNFIDQETHPQELS